MYCTTCGAKNAADNNYCRQCGQKLDRASTAKISEDDFDRAKPEEEKVTSLLEHAYQLRKEKDIPGAIALCTEVLQLRPDSTTANSLLGQLYEQSGEREKAITQYERVLQLNPGSIADRVKLDELRDSAAAAPPVIKQAPRVVIMDHNGAPLRGGLLWGVGLGLLLVISGGILALMLQNHTQEAANNSSVGVKQALNDSPGKHALQPDVNKATDNKAAVNSAAENKIGSQPAQMNNGPYFMPGITGMPQPNYNSPGVQYSTPPRNYRPPVYSQAPVTPLPVSHPPAVAKTKPGAFANNRDNDMGSERVHLESDGDPHNVVIHVSSHDDKTNKVDKPAGPVDAVPKETIKITAHKDTGDSTSDNPPTSEASSQIAAGQDKLNKMDYASAIKAFQQARAGANDELGYVYEKLGDCYRQLNDNRNARSCYERGIDEFKKLESAGRQVDRAHNGKRICENGIKLCSTE